MRRIHNEEFLNNMQKIATYYFEIFGYLIEKKELFSPLEYINFDRWQNSISEIISQLIQHPENFSQINLEYMHNFQNLLVSSMQKFTQVEEMTEQKNTNFNINFQDKRFSQPQWGQNIYFDFVKQYYLITSDWIKKTTAQYKLGKENQRYLEFITEQFIDAVSPANFPFTNPIVIKESLESGFANIAKGMHNFLNDLKQSGDFFKLSTTNRSYFKVGKDLAATKGKIIYENELMQLICYEPKTVVYSIPMLVVPPWINKYYILDLSQNNSLIKWLVDNGFQVFLISWVSAKKKHANMEFEDYLKHGVLDAIAQINKIGYSKINSIGYCLGGTLLAIALSYLKKNNNDVVASASFLATLLDFSNPGSLGNFINKHTFKAIEQEVTKKGYLDGKYISNSFSLIRANDLIWSFFVNNYLLGKAPAVFDILYWNSDSTNLPAKMYLYYLKNMYLENKLQIPNALEMLGTKIDISEIDIPSFSLAAKADHIAIWTAVYDSYKLLAGDKTFCLTEAGHVAGVVNPANNTKYSHFVGGNIVEDANLWLKSAQANKASWWNCWKEWLEKRSGNMENAINYNELKSIEQAPGRYVKN